MKDPNIHISKLSNFKPQVPIVCWFVAPTATLLCAGIITTLTDRSANNDNHNDNAMRMRIIRRKSSITILTEGEAPIMITNGEEDEYDEKNIERMKILSCQ